MKGKKLLIGEILYIRLFFPFQNLEKKRFLLVLKTTIHYTDEEIKTCDSEGRRLYLGNEFDQSTCMVVDIQTF